MSLLDDVSIVVTPNGYKAGELYAVVPVPSEGAEEITNGDFATDSAWTLSSGLTFSAGAILFDDDNDNLFQNKTPTLNTRYKLTITKTGSGTLRFRSGFAGTDGVRIDIPESGIIYFTSTSDTNRIQIYGDISDVSATLNSVSVKEYTAADMDVTRATAATRVDEAGLVNYAEIIGSEEVTDGDFSQEGAEKVTNGDFSSSGDWYGINVNGWSIDTGTSTLNFTNATNYVFQGISTVSGNSYKVTLDIELDSGTIVAKAFSGQDVITVTSTGRQTVTGYFQEIDSNANFGFVASGSASGKIHSVSVKEVGADWVKGAGWTISGGNGVLTSGSGILTQTLSGLIIGRSYKLSWETGLNFQVRLGGASIGYFSGSKSLIISSAAGTLLEFLPNGTQTGTIDNVSVKEVTRDNVPRIDYSGGGCPHILAEPQRTNLITTSEDFNAYTIAGSTVTPNSTTAPDGTNSGVLVTQGSSVLILRANNVVAPSTTYTFSGFFKSSGSITQVALDITDNGSTTFNLTSEWQRFSMTSDSRPGGSPYTFVDVAALNVNQGDTFYAWGLQVEEGSYATSYIPTSGSTVTRNQDQFTRDGIGSLINSTEGVLFVEMAALSNEALYREISLSDGTTNNVVEIRYTPIANQIQFVVRNAGAVEVATTITLSNALDFNKIAFSFKSNDYKMYVNGSEVGTDLSGTMPSGLNTLSLDWAGNNKLFGKVKQLQVYKTALTDEQLIQLTGTSGTDFYESYAEMASALTYTIQ